MFQQRRILYALLNAGFLLLVAALAAVDPSGRTRPFYLAALFLLCSLPVMFEKPLNGPYAILFYFLGMYFVYFGVGDLMAPWSDRPLISRYASTGALSAAELTLLVGLGLLILGYQAAVVLVNRSRSAAAAPRDWPKGVVVTVGLLLWAIGTYAAWVWSVDLMTDTSNATARRAVAGSSDLMILLLLLAQLAKPLGIVILAYAQTVYRRVHLTVLLIAVVIVQVIYGFIVDIKGEAMLAGMLVIVTKMLIEGKLPKAWLAAGALFVVFAFPVLQAHRVVAGTRDVNHAMTAQNLGKMLDLALAAKDRINEGRHRANTFLERASLKENVEMIVARTGNEVAWQEGATLAPILTAFVPKIIWAGKPSVPTGQIMNREFHVSINPDTYISPSHLGELYWNFGWAGVLVGMTLIGLLLGYVGGRCDLSTTTSITRLLFATVTIRQAIQGFEGVIAVSYVLWLRSALGIACLHWVLARVPAIQVAQGGDSHSHDDGALVGQTRTVPAP